MSAAEIEEAEMAITRSLQTIDANFSRACALVNGMVRKARHSVRSTKKVHGAVQPWKRLLASLAPPELSAQYNEATNPEAKTASPAVPATASSSPPTGSQSEPAADQMGLLSPSRPTPSKQANADQSGMDSFISEGDDTAMQLFGVDESPNNDSPALPKLSSRATALLTAADKSTMARAAGLSLGSVAESPESAGRGEPMTAADLDVSAASVGLLGIDDSPAVPQLSASLGTSLRRSSARTPGKSRGGGGSMAQRSFLSTLSPILPQPGRTVGNAATPEAAAPPALGDAEGSDSDAGDSPAMPEFKSAATRAVLGRSTSAAASAAGAGASAAGGMDAAAAAAAAAAAHGSDSDEDGGQGDFDLSLFPSTFRSGAAAAQLIDVWSQFAMQDEGSFFDGGQSTASTSAAAGALSELEVHQGVPDMTDKKLQLLLGMLESKGLVRKFTWQGQTMWRKR